MYIKYQILEVMGQVVQAYKKDITMYARTKTNGDDKYANRIINTMIKEQLLIEKEVKKNRKDNKQSDYKTVTISKKGKNVLKEKLDKEVDKEIESGFQTNSQATLRARLNDSRIKLMFMMCNVNVAPETKPRLIELYRILKEKTDPRKMQICTETLKAGIYYTVKEMHEFMDEMNFGISDTTYASRIRGMYISPHTCLMVYITQRGDNKILRTTKNIEKKVVSLMQPVLEVTTVNRDLPELSKKRKSRTSDNLIVDTLRKNSTWGLVISDGDSLVYSMTTGNPNGIIRKKDVSKIQIAKNEQQKDKKYTWLIGDEEIYPRLFVTPFTEAGIGSLDYLCHTRAEEWLEDSKNYFRQLNRFEENLYNPLYPHDEVYRGQKIPSVYMPVFEINELRKISEMDYTVTVLTYRDMIDAISHATRKQLRYYDAETMEYVDDNEILQYAETGYPLGEQMILERLAEYHVKCDKREIQKLPKKYEMDYTSFFNGIVNEEIDLEQVIRQLPVAPVKKEKKKYNIRKQLAFTVPTEMATTIKHAAKNKDLSVNRYLIQMIVKNMDEIKRDAKEKEAE